MAEPVGVAHEPTVLHEDGSRELGYLYVVLDDGQVWRLDTHVDDWEVSPPVPDTPAERGERAAYGRD